MYKSLSDGHLQHEKRWTNEASECLLDLMEERRFELFGAEKEITPHRRMEIWKDIAEQMREKGFNQTTATANKKYCNMRRTYMSNRRMKERDRMQAQKRQKPGGKSRRKPAAWPYYERVGSLLKLAGVPESDEDIGQRGSHKYEDEDEASESEDEEEESSGIPGVAVNRAIRNLLQTNMDPVLILEDLNSETVDVTKIEVDDSETAEFQGVQVVSVNDLVEEDVEIHGDVDWNSTTSADPKVSPPSRVSARNLQRKAKALKKAKRHSLPSASFAGKKSNIKVTRDGTAVWKPSSSSSADTMVVEEVQGLRQEVRGINRNLEKLVDVHNRLNDNFERFLTSLRLRNFSK